MDDSFGGESAPNVLEFPGTNEVPPPPEFGMVLEAPPPRFAAAEAPAEASAPAPRRGATWLVGGLGFAVVAGAIGFLLGNHDDPPGPAVARADAAPAAVAAPPALASEPPDPSEPAEPSQPSVPTNAAVAADDGPCPAGMILVEGGKMYMGTDRDVPVLAPAHPAHQVEVAAYCIDAQEVTVAEYRSCSDLGECKRANRTSEWPGSSEQDTAALDELCNERYDDRGEHPINCVTWEQARHFCEWAGGRLPSEAEWEMAARGSDGRVYPWGDQSPGPEHMNGCGAECKTWRAANHLPATTALLYPASDKYPGTAPVGSFPAGRTQWGLDDVAGNVFEWTADPFRSYPGADAPPPGAEDDDASRRVIRGGAFNSFLPDHADPALRFPQDERAHTHGIGFRCAADVRR